MCPTATLGRTSKACALTVCSLATLATTCTCSWDQGLPTGAYIPAYVPIDAIPLRLPLPGSPRLPTATTMPAGLHVPPSAAAAPAAQSAADALVQAAQVEALKLQVARLRQANAALQQQLAAARAAHAATAKQAAMHQLASLQLGAATAAGSPAAPGGGVPKAQAAAAAAALQDEPGVALPQGTDMVPLIHLQQLHACYTRRLAELQQRHADALAAQAAEAQAQMRRQVRESCAMLHGTMWEDGGEDARLV